MEELTLQTITDNNLVLYKYIRGSHAYGLNVETSDQDTAGVYCAPLEYLIGTRTAYNDQISDEKQDNTMYELEKFIRLLGNSNPNILESLFIPDHCIIYKHPVMEQILVNRDMFLTKKCFQSFFSYGKSQVAKAKSLHKMINIEKPDKKDILDFCYTQYKQGSTNIKNWLAYRGMHQEFIGCVNVPDMPCTVNLFYDWGAHIAMHPNIIHEDELQTAWTYHEKIHKDPDYMPDVVKRLKNLMADPTEKDGHLVTFLNRQLYYCRFANMLELINQVNHLNGNFSKIKDWLIAQKDVERHYRGMVILTNSGELSNELRLSSVLKDEMPICTITCNINGYSQSCKKYKSYKEWEKMRNPVRYESNLHKSYDAKNMMHCFRLMKMCIEIAQGKGFNLDRRNIDREFLLDIRNHKYEYDELIEKLEVLTEEMEEAVKNSTLPEEIDLKKLDQLCVDIRKTFWNMQKESAKS